MSPFKKNLQWFLIFFFTAISIVLVLLGINRAKKGANVATTPDLGQGSTPASPVPDTTGALAFSGNPYQTPWGNATASIKVKNGRVVAVTMPQVPNSPPSVYAEQYLVQQALSLGTANIQGVSGATYTSLAFKSSLESALAKAKAQGQSVAGGTGTASKIAPIVPRKYSEDDEELDFGSWYKK